jgi:hypothetical protein
MTGPVPPLTAVNAVFGFLLVNLDCQRLPVVGIKFRPTSVLNEYSLLRLYHRGQKSGLRHRTEERDATSERHEARHSPVRLCVTSLRAGPIGDLRRTKAWLSRRSRETNRANRLNQRSNIGIPYQRDPPKGGNEYLGLLSGRILRCQTSEGISYEQVYRTELIVKQVKAVNDRARL